MPKVRTVGDIKTNLLRPALTSHFEVTIPKPPGEDFDKFLKANKFDFNLVAQDQLNLLCSETILPGSNLATLELNSDHTGVTERHAYRRIYDDRIDLTFYVDAVKYLPIIYFELWIKFIMGESIAKKDEIPGIKDSYYYYRAIYPKEYICEQGLIITKFERTGRGNSYRGSTLTYNFVNAFPIAVSSMPVSYDSSSLLKCTVSFSYIRYYIESVKKTLPPNANPTPGNSAQFNTDQFKGIDYSTFSTSEASKTIGFSNKVETQEQYYNRIYGEA